MKEYRIYKLENPSIADEVTEFFLPESGKDRVHTYSRKIKRLTTLIDYKRKGYRVTSILLVDEETYLNTRLDEAVKEYSRVDAEERNEKMLYTDATKSLAVCMIHEHKLTIVKRIASIIRRLQSKEYTVKNHFALSLYERYLRF